MTNNEKGRDNEIFLSSSGGEIRTYLLPSQTSENQLYPPSIPNTPMTAPMTPQIATPAPMGNGVLQCRSVAGDTQTMDFPMTQPDSSQL